MKTNASLILSLSTIIFVIAAFFLMRHMVYQPMLNLNHFEARLPLYLFYLLAGGTTLIAFGTSQLYDPYLQQFTISGKIQKIRIYGFSCLAGILVAIFVSLRSGLNNHSTFFVLISGLVWFFAGNFSRAPIFWHQMIKALLLGLIPIIPAAYEVPLLNHYYAKILNQHHYSFNFIYGWTAAFGVFIFLLSLLTSLYNSKCLNNSLQKTLKYERILAVVMILGLFVFFSHLYINYLEDTFSLVYFLFILIISGTAIKAGWNDLHGRKRKKIKILLYIAFITGISYAFWVPYILNQQFI